MVAYSGEQSDRCKCRGRCCVGGVSGLGCAGDYGPCGISGEGGCSVDVVPNFAGGYRVEPTLFMTSDNGAQIDRDEIFGPVAAIIPFEANDEAIAIANDSRFGLASGVWTQDLHRVHRMIRDIESGDVWVNTYMQTRFELPFGGIKESGYGQNSVLDFSRVKAAVISLGDQGLGATIGGAVPATD